MDNYITNQNTNTQTRCFRMALQDDAQQVLSLYEEAKGGEFCVWNDSYPSVKELAHDLETQNLYVMTCGEELAGAVSVVPENELDRFECWSWEGGKEIARVVVAKAYQGQGLSFEMVQHIQSIFRKKGWKAIRLSVAKTNIPAYKTYIKAGFVTVGEADMYESSYYLLEKAIDTDPIHSAAEIKLHPSPFEKIKSGEKKPDYMILINGENRLPDGFEDTVEIISVENDQGKIF